METVDLTIHEHPLLPVTRFSRDDCKGCGDSCYIYGGYRCNELGCGSMFHKECAESLPEEINHSFHPDHPLKLLKPDRGSYCDHCRFWCNYGYFCLICNFTLHLRCATSKNSNLQHHHNSHPQHKLDLLITDEVPDAGDKNCVLCGNGFNKYYDDECKKNLRYCDICNFSICEACAEYQPPVCVESPTTHEHQLHLVPRRIDFTCDACGTPGDRSPYFCLQCNFMIHWECIDLPRVIKINRHDHRISYTRRLGHEEEWKCKICRKKVDGFYGAYTCGKCPTFAVHSLCATKKNVWDMIELEGVPEEEEIPPFEVIDDNTIKHFSHEHNLQHINKDRDGRIQPENIVCEACVLQILSEPFYSCKHCNFILHENCANLPRKKRLLASNLPYTLLTGSRHEVDWCDICGKDFSGFRYKALRTTYVVDRFIDVRCAAISDTVEYGGHQHPLYYSGRLPGSYCSQCNYCSSSFYSCDDCDYKLGNECLYYPEKVMRIRYDDHPLFLSFHDKNAGGYYWCEACEKKIGLKDWFFYTCKDCGTTLHKSCVVGDISYIMPGSHLTSSWLDMEVFSNTSSSRPPCSACHSRCKLPSVLKIYKARNRKDVYVCSSLCSRFF